VVTSFQLVGVVFDKLEARHYGFYLRFADLFSAGQPIRGA